MYHIPVLVINALQWLSVHKQLCAHILSVGLCFQFLLLFFFSLPATSMVRGTKPPFKLEADQLTCSYCNVILYTHHQSSFSICRVLHLCGSAFVAVLKANLGNIYAR